MNPTSPTASAPSPSARLTKREFLSTFALGLGIAGVCVAIAFIPKARQPTHATAPAKLDHPRQLIPFNLTDRTGRPVTEAELAGKFVVVNFAFTSCSLSCRAVNDRMTEIQRLVADAPDVRLVSLSVDPATDTAAALAKFADSFGADTNRWLFLTGEKDGLYRLIETSFMSRSPELVGLVPGGFAHTDRIMLVDPRGNVCASFNGLSRSVATNVVNEIRRRRKQIP